MDIISWIGRESRVTRQLRGLVAWQDVFLTGTTEVGAARWGVRWTSIEERSGNGGRSSSRQRRRTPLEFVEPDVYWSTKWSRRAEDLIVKLGFQQRPFQRIPNDRDFKPSSLLENLYLAVPVSVFSLIHFCGWNLHFPTAAERLLWRVNCVAMAGSLAVYGVSEMMGFQRSGYRLASLDILGSYKKRPPGSLFFHVLSTAYFVSRLCIIVEAVASLRALPNYCYQDLQWTHYLPRFT
ncbi:hypothetical protein PG984_012835 [Apiospora sp. TS-2023a]